MSKKTFTDKILLLLAFWVTSIIKKQMNMRIFMIVPLFLTFLSMSSAQVSLAPELGVYYRPFTLGGINSYRDIREPEMYLGLLGEVKLTQKLFLQTRVSYIFKNNHSISMDIVTPPEFNGSKLYQEEMNFDILILYKLFNKLKIGVGHGFGHKLGTYYISDFVSYKETNYLNSSYLNYLSINMNYMIGNFGIVARYHHIYKPEDFRSYLMEFQNEHNAFSFGVYYKFFGGKNGSKKR